MQRHSEHFVTKQTEPVTGLSAEMATRPADIGSHSQEYCFDITTYT